MNRPSGARSPFRGSSGGDSIGSYQLGRRLGAGTSGTVYKVDVDDVAGKRESENARHLALKLLHQPLANADERRRFQRECKALAQLSDAPAILTLVDSGVEEDGSAWIVTELLDTNYRDRLASLGSIPADEVIEVGYQLSAGLAQAHANDIVHGDIKPSNVFIADAGFIVLGDFGSSIDPASTLTANFAVSLAYAAPELLATGRATVASDLYALGSTLYHLVTGNLPRPVLMASTGRSVGSEAVATRLMASDVSTENIEPGLSPIHGEPALTALLERLLAPNSDARPVSAKEVARELQSLKRGRSLVLPVSVPVPSPVQATTSKPIVSATDFATNSEPTPVPAPATTRAGTTTEKAAETETETESQEKAKAKLVSGASDSANRNTLQRRTLAALAFGVVALILAALLLDIIDFPSANTTNAAEGNALQCPPNALICESFDRDSANWLRDQEDGSVAAFTLTESGYAGTGLALIPTTSPKIGSSFRYRLFHRASAIEPLSLSVHVKAARLGPGRFWMDLIQLVRLEGHTWSINMQQHTDGELQFGTFYYDGGGPDDADNTTDHAFGYDRWLCVEAVFEPNASANEQAPAVHVFVDGTRVASLPSNAARLPEGTYEIVLGAPRIDVPRDAPEVVYDSLVVEQSRKLRCTADNREETL